LSKIIVSAANNDYFGLLSDLISSIRQHDPLISIGVLDVGLDETQRAALAKRVQTIVTPAWDYSFSLLPESYFRAMTARPHLPKYFPGYETIMWIDADAWVQRWDAVDAYFMGAQKRGLAIAQEMHRCYANMYNNNNSRQLFTADLRAAFGDEIARQIWMLPMLNVGCFAMRAECEHWQRWAEKLGETIRRGAFSFFSEQTAFNVVIYTQKAWPCFLPARFNWLCVHAPPQFDERRGLYVEPELPHDEIGIVHRASAQYPGLDFSYSHFLTRRSHISGWPNAASGGGLRQN
jgi:lipopolysaccharide biosynthesis glycosyltransferase